VLSFNPEHYYMKRIFEELLFQMLVDQVMTQIYLLIEWINTMAWQVWLA
jgi:hypothetical protein